MYSLELMPRWVIRPAKYFALAMALFILFLFLPWQQFSSGTGRVIALDPNERIQDIHAPITGIISTWHVREGSQVKKGDVLVELSDTDPQIIKRLESEKIAALRSQEAADLALQTSKINLNRQENLFKQGLAARKDFEKARIEVSKYEMEMAKAQSVFIKAQRDLARQLTQKIVSPINGTVVRVRAGEGAQVVKAGDALLVLAPTTSSIAAEVWVSGNDIALLHTGMPARLQFAGWPALQLPGWPSLAIGTFKGKVQLVDAAASSEGKFRVLIVPDQKWPSTLFVRQGTIASGYIHIGRVSVGWELWRTLNGFPAQIMNIKDEIDEILNGTKGDA